MYFSSKEKSKEGGIEWYVKMFFNRRKLFETIFVLVFDASDHPSVRCLKAIYTPFYMFGW
jgi:hypothetical protein